ncbi:maleylpyruvate isomerase N-terminal domain-containing protein [Nocardioides panacis]|uniref:Maleylpyruvate isomerase N-terminal domain-containing protein n=1 Tax=Nocardioides panacis TaxID=2849501 RepID=A0A975SZK2_9ACTN|nr:maleylpyruvate isomerase N-terminal domain-containing protein [Nocardioides panacis]
MTHRRPTAAVEAVVVLSRALDQAGDVLAAVHPDQLARPTPCADWDVARLIGHLVGAPVRFLQMARGGEPDWSAVPPAGHRGLGGGLPVPRRRPDPPLAPGRGRGGRRAGGLADRGDRRAHLGRGPRHRSAGPAAAGGRRARAGVHVGDADPGEPRGGVRAGGAGAGRRPRLRPARGVRGSSPRASLARRASGRPAPE